MAFFKKSKAAPLSGAEKPTDWKAELRSIVLIILGIMGFKSVAYSNHDIPSESMLPGLMVGDYIGVSRFAYGFSRYSVPLVPLPDSLKGRIFFSKPDRGDVVVFRYPGDDSLIYIKRLIGLPGDTIEMRDGQLVLNGKPVPKVPAGTLTQEISDNYKCKAPTTVYDALGTPNNIDMMAPYVRPDGTCQVPLFRETLPGGKSYLVDDLYRGTQADNKGPFMVPQGHYFMMGDNRDNSSDSRFDVIPGTIIGGVGFLPEDNLVGRADFIYLSANGKGRWYQPWKWPAMVRTERLFDKID
jgi:signal peptidase I